MIRAGSQLAQRPSIRPGFVPTVEGICACWRMGSWDGRLLGRPKPIWKPRWPWVRTPEDWGHLSGELDDQPAPQGQMLLAPWGLHWRTKRGKVSEWRGLHFSSQVHHPQAGLPIPYDTPFHVANGAPRSNLPSWSEGWGCKETPWCTPVGQRPSCAQSHCFCASATASHFAFFFLHPVSYTSAFFPFSSIFSFASSTLIQSNPSKGWINRVLE